MKEEKVKEKMRITSVRSQNLDTVTVVSSVNITMINKWASFMFKNPECLNHHEKNSEIKHVYKKNMLRYPTRVRV